MRLTPISEAKQRLPLPQLLAKIGDAERAKKSAKCPFHDDQRESFSVFKGNDGGHYWKCHAGCGHGDAVDYLEKRFDLSTRAAIRRYLAEAGLNSGEVKPATKTREAFDWPACVAAFTDEAKRQLAEWRGLSLEFVGWLHGQRIVGLHSGKLAFAVHGQSGKVVSCHKLVDRKKRKWTYEPEGNGIQPLIFGDTRHAGFVLCFESQWDAFAVMDRLAWHAGDGLRDTAVLVTRGAQNGKLIAAKCSSDAVVYAFVQNDQPDPKTGKIPSEDWLKSIAAHAGCKVLRVTTPTPHKDANDWTRAGATKDDIEAVIRNAKLVDVPKSAPQMPARSNADDLQRAMADSRPKIRLPGTDRLLSDFASELVHVLLDKAIFSRNGEIVTLTGHELKPMTPQTFRSWAEKFFVGYRAKTIGENSFHFDVTMTDNEARGTLAAPQFTEALRRVRRVNRARLPIFGPDGKSLLLPNGYHPETQTLTLANVEFDLDMQLNIAVETINDLLTEFCFADGDRSRSVAVAAMTGLFANQLLPEKSLRPCFVFVANAEGAGKTLLAQICITPTLGSMPVGSKPDDDDEMRKTILTAVREAQSVIFLDNLKGRLSSEPLEAFLSAPSWSGRKLGVNETLTGENLATVFCTGNGMTVSPDMRRRSLFVELHLEVERAEDRRFNRLLDLATLLDMRPQVLAALWSMVKHWDTQGRPKPSRGHSAFPSWANIIGGIVEAAGFSCPLETANVTAAADPDGENMRRLVSAMAQIAAPRTFSELIELAREHGLFEHIIGADGEELGRREKSTFGKLLGRYDRRLVSNHRFIVEGKGKTRRYQIENGNGGNGGNGVSDEKNSLYAREFGRKDHADHAKPGHEATHTATPALPGT